MKKITPFKEALEQALGLPVIFHTEVFTSQEAKLIQGENAMHDASAAAIILQSYIDREADRLLNSQNTL
jgi:RNase H-fold protein (predicted Holliday junction resolvase)